MFVEGAGISHMLICSYVPLKWFTFASAGRVVAMRSSEWVSYCFEERWPCRGVHLCIYWGLRYLEVVRAYRSFCYVKCVCVCLIFVVRAFHICVLASDVCLVRSAYVGLEYVIFV